MASRFRTAGHLKPVVSVVCATVIALGCAAVVITVKASPGVGRFAGLDYSVDLPPDWIGGGAQTFAQEMEALSQSNRDVWSRIKETPIPTGDNFVGISVKSPAFVVAIVVLGTYPDASTADVLAAAEHDNVASLQELPNLRDAPAASRRALPIGEAVRIEWSETVTLDSGETAVQRAVGFAIAVPDKLYTVVFRYPDSQPEHGTELLPIIDSFQVSAEALTPSP